MFRFVPADIPIQFPTGLVIALNAVEIAGANTCFRGERILEREPYAFRCFRRSVSCS